MSTTENIYLPNIAVIDRITDNIEDVKTFYALKTRPRAAFKKFRPGQFAGIPLRVGEFPLSLPPSPTEEEVFFTCRTVGTCSAALHTMKAGDKFAVRGPYGNGFPMEDYYGKSLVFVAGASG
jgi:NAD(P)H-flavin reductase